ncbi:MAG: hypothetical protein EB059_08630 [Alphaproteobacteria bacterium]|nr:hypothetical protein [Alphaproteobacteria bacterium]
MKMQILYDGTTNFQPNGSTIRLSISDNNTIISNSLYITSNVNSNNASSGAVIISGGLGVSGNTFIDGILNVNGNISFNGSSPSTSYSSGATYFNGGIGVICTVGATSETSGGGLSIAGGVAIGKNAILGGNISVYNSDQSTSSVNGSGIFYGGVGINGQVNIRSDSTAQIRLIPVTNANETSIYFGNQNNYITAGSWKIGQNINSIGGGNFGIYNADNGNYIRFVNNTIFIDKYMSNLNTLNFYNNSIDNYITFRTSENNIGWSIGRILSSNDNFQISRYSSGNLIGPILTSDVKTGNINILGTENSNSNQSGGSLTVNGGASIVKDVYIGGNIYSNNISFSGNIQSNSNNDINIMSYLNLTGTNQSYNLTTGSLITVGGITIQCTVDALSITNGGGLLIAGGASIIKSLYVGNTISSDTITSSTAFINNSTITNVTSTNVVTTNVKSTNVVTTNVTSTNVITTNVTSTNVLNTNISSSNINSVNQSVTNLSAGILNVNNLTTGNINFTGSLYQNGIIYISSQWTTTSGNILTYTSGNISITNGFTSSFNSNTIGNLFTTGGNIGIRNTSPNQILELGAITYASNQDGGIRIGTNNYIGINDQSYRYIDLRLKSNTLSQYKGSIIGALSGGISSEYEYMSFSQDGFINIYGKSNFTNNLSCSNSSTGSVVLQGGLSINCITNAINVSNGGALTVAGGASIAGDLIVGGTILYANAAEASTTYAYLTLTASDWSTDVGNGSLIVFGGISIQNTANAYSATQGNSLTVAGGVGIGADLYVGQNAYIPNLYVSNTMNSINSTVGGLVVPGGISISKTSNATSTTCGGALTVAGGVGISADVYVGGTVTSSSDVRLKKNIRELKNVLDTIDNINPIKYNLINDEINDNIGFIAQDFEHYYPELLKKHSNDAYYSLAYDRITALNMACIKELKNENLILKHRILKLENIIYNLNI